ncbi:hypothetical protein [Methylobacterium sp. Leaf466]|uniref:hypothetical protein n=1 Tax=Methylobacterium sp. Leaf466 TaxID=1736386 RepID=UPI001FCD9562|nr:hypothetical protein [Methylobacterium sp. Leaf466]
MRLRTCRPDVAIAFTGAASPAAPTAADDPLVTTEWPEKNLDDPKLRIVEVSVDPGLLAGRAGTVSRTVS